MTMKSNSVHSNFSNCTDKEKEAAGEQLPIVKKDMSDMDIEGSGAPQRESWGRKLDFLLSVIGFAVDLGNVWRFPYICYRNGGGAFLIPYLVMLIFGGLPLFYMELALGQFQRSGCITVWKRICPMFKGIGFGICVIASYVAMYYNTIIAWSLYFLFSTFKGEVPWSKCGNPWNTPNCSEWTVWSEENNTTMVRHNHSTSPAAEFFERNVLEVHRSTGLGDLGNVKWSIALCLMGVYAMVYFSLWKGIKSVGKAVWITATLPYLVLIILLIRGVTLPGSYDGIKYYLTPRWEMLLTSQVWTDAAAQIFFSLGPGFGVLLALSSYNKFHNNCYKDALITATINCATSFMAGFVVFSVLGYMANRQGTDIDSVTEEGPGLVFVVYPEAIATLKGSVFWAIIFFLMLITLGLDSTFSGLEAMVTGICDMWPQAVGRRRELFVLCLVIYCFFGALPTTTYGGNYVLSLMDAHAAPISLLFICFLEAIAVNWFYGVTRFSQDLENMLGFKPGLYWRICWVAISPVFLLVLFILIIIQYQPLVVGSYHYPTWGTAVGWIITCSSIVPIPGYMIYRFCRLKGGWRKRWQGMIEPEERPTHPDEPTQPAVPVFV